MSAVIATTCPDAFAEQAQGFADTVATYINQGAIAVMISVGHQAGLFESLASLGCGQFR